MSAQGRHAAVFDPYAQTPADTLRQRRPALRGFCGQIAPQHRIEKPQPDIEHRCPHIARRAMHPERIAVIAALHQDGSAPEPGNFGFMRRPILNMNGKDRAKAGMIAHRVIKGGHDGVDLVGGNRKAGRKGRCHDGPRLPRQAKPRKRRERRTPLTFAPLNPIRRAMSRISMPLHRIIGPAS